MQQIRILHGTPQSGKSLCESCVHSATRRGQNLQVEVTCRNWHFRTGPGDAKVIPFKVAECTGYAAFNTPSIGDMEKIAWIVQPRLRGATGFATNAVADVEIVPPKPAKDDSL